MKLVQIHFCTGEKETMTVILQYLNIYYLSSHSVGRSTYFTPRHPLHLYVENRGKKRWVRLTGRDRVSNGRRVLSEELNWALNKAWFWKRKCEDGRQSGCKHWHSNAPSQQRKWSAGEKETPSLFSGRINRSSTHRKHITDKKRNHEKFGKNYKKSQRFYISQYVDTVWIFTMHSSHTLFYYFDLKSNHFDVDSFNLYTLLNIL